MGLAALTVATIASIPLREAAAGPTPGSGGGDSIAFARAPDGAGDIYLIGSTGTGLVRLTTDSGNGGPVWSPDGKLLAVTHTGDLGVPEIGIVRAAGKSNVRLLPRSSGLYGSPAWSPDGGRIAWTASSPGAAGVLVMGSRGGRPHSLTFGSHASRPRWSPDGRRIAFLDATRGGIALVASDGRGGARLVAAAQPGPSAPAWSPDGKRIAFVDSRGRLRVVALDGSRGHVLTGSVRDAAFPAWSPSGQAIAFVAGARSALFLVGADGRSLRRLAPAADGASAPSWSPGGKAIAFADAAHHIEIVSLDGRRRLLTRATAFDADPAWRP
ncbi:MAG: TolB family protein [Gaiellaceae bacterium]